MLKFNQNVKLDPNSIISIKRHAIIDYHECAYSISLDSGDQYCILPGSILSNPMNMSLLTLFIQQVDSGDAITIDYLKDCYEENQYCHYALGIFGGITWLYDFDSAFVKPVRNTLRDILCKFFYGITDDLPETVDERMHLKHSVCRTDGSFVWEKSSAVETTFKNSVFSLGEDNEVFVDDSTVRLCKTLFLRDQLIKNDIIDVCYYNGALLAMDVDLDYVFVDYDAQSAWMTKPENGAVVKNNVFYSMHKNTLIKLSTIQPIEDPTVVKDGVLYLENGIELEYSLSSGPNAYFHVKGYQMRSDDGSPIRWAGAKWSASDIARAGLDSDGVDTAAYNEAPSKMIFDDYDTGDIQETQQVERRTADTATVIISNDRMKDLKKVNPSNEDILIANKIRFIKSENIERLTTILTDASIAL